MTTRRTRPVFEQRTGGDPSSRGALRRMPIPAVTDMEDVAEHGPAAMAVARSAMPTSSVASSSGMSARGVMDAPPVAQFGLGGLVGGIGGAIGGLARRAGGAVVDAVKDFIPGTIDDAIIDAGVGVITNTFGGGGNATQQEAGALGGAASTPPVALPCIGCNGPQELPAGPVLPNTGGGLTTAVQPGTAGLGWQRMEGQFGVGTRPIARQDSRGRVYRDCPPGDVLGKDGVCYNKRSLKRSERLNPGPKPKRRRRRRSHSHSHSHRRRRRRSSSCYQRYRGRCYTRAQARHFIPANRRR